MYFWYLSCIPFLALFHLSPFLNPMWFFPLIMLSFQLVGPSVFILSLCWSFHHLTDSYCPLSESSLHPFCLSDTCHVCQLVESLRFTSGILLTSPFSLSPPLPPLLLFSLLPVAVAERLYSQLERNRLLSNELKLTLHDLCDWWQGPRCPLNRAYCSHHWPGPQQRADCLF